MTARIGVITFPGSLDDVDALRAARVIGAEPVSLWHADADLHGVDAVVVPGGFSYGDYLRAGAIAAQAPVMRSVIDAARGGLPVLGICNGFQVLCEAGLLPGALMRNAGLTFRCRDQYLRVERASTVWTGRYAVGQQILIPLKHTEGRYVASERDLDELEAEGRVLFRYSAGPDAPGSGVGRYDIAPHAGAAAGGDGAPRAGAAAGGDGAAQGGAMSTGGGGARPGGAVSQGGGGAPRGGAVSQGGGGAPRGGAVSQGGGGAAQGGAMSQGGGGAPRGGAMSKEVQGVSAAAGAANPNGSMRDIAGVCSADGRIAGLMPHPEHAIDALTGPSTDGLGMFIALADALGIPVPPAVPVPAGAR